jgi:hypothetical protein
LWTPKNWFLLVPFFVNQYKRVSSSSIFCEPI